MVEEGTFRHDLLYRINVVKITLPPLRERGEDVLRLAEHFVQYYAQEMGKQVRSIRSDALEVIAQYHWPGNVRELQNVVRRGIAMTRGTEIGVEDLPDSLVAASGQRSVTSRATSTPPRTVPTNADVGSGTFFEERAGRMAVFEKDYLTAKLKEHGGDVTTAAREAAIPRGTFYRLMKNHDLRANDFRGGGAG